MSKELVQKWFNNLPNEEKDMPLLIYKGIAYSPRQALDEVNRGTATGAYLQTLIEAGKYGTTMADEQALAKTRATMRMQSKPNPNKPIWVALPSSGIPVKAYTPAELAQAIQSGSPAGKQWVNAEIEVMKKLVQKK